MTNNTEKEKPMRYEVVRLSDRHVVAGFSHQADLVAYLNTMTFDERRQYKWRITYAKGN